MGRYILNIEPVYLNYYCVDNTCYPGAGGVCLVLKYSQYKNGSR
jgi:hypothetical protein